MGSRRGKTATVAAPAKFHSPRTLRVNQLPAGEPDPDAWKVCLPIRQLGVWAHRRPHRGCPVAALIERVGILEDASASVVEALRKAGL